MYEIGFACKDKEEAMRLREFVMEFFENEEEKDGRKRKERGNTNK